MVMLKPECWAGDAWEWGVEGQEGGLAGWSLVLNQQAQGSMGETPGVERGENEKRGVGAVGEGWCGKGAQRAAGHSGHVMQQPVSVTGQCCRSHSKGAWPLQAARLPAGKAWTCQVSSPALPVRSSNIGAAALLRAWSKEAAGGGPQPGRPEPCLSGLPAGTPLPQNLLWARWSAMRLYSGPRSSLGPST